MFSPNDLVHLVFASETDTYYTDGLLTLDLDRYLWFRLHERYSAVFYLSMTGNSFEVKTYGDRLPRSVKLPKRVARAGGRQPIGRWIADTLTAGINESAAVVCSLEDINAALRYNDWDKDLQTIAKAKARTGILVIKVPIIAEDAVPLLLKSPIFEYLRDNAVLNARMGGERSLYDSIRGGKGESCVFLNTFTKKAINAILMRLCLERDDRELPPGGTDALADYLARYLSSFRLQLTEPLGEDQRPSPNMGFQDLYDMLRDKGVWEELTRRCIGGDAMRGLMPDDAMAFQIARDKNGFAGKCLSLPPLKGRLDGEQERKITEKLLAVRKEAARPKNRPENPRLHAVGMGLVDMLYAEKNADTYMLILDGILFCAKWLYVGEGSEEEKRTRNILECFIQCVGFSSRSDEWRAQLRTLEQYKNPSKIVLERKRQLTNMLDGQARTMKNLRELLEVHMTDASFGKSPEELMDAVRGLKLAENILALENAGKSGSNGESGDPDGEQYDLEELEP